jgi:hypothetical protein
MLKLGLETIKAKLDDKFVDDLIGVMTDIGGIVENKGYVKSVSLLTDSDIEVRVKELAQITYTRFGIKPSINLVSDNTHGPIYINPIIPINSHVLYADVMLAFKMIKERFREGRVDLINEDQKDWYSNSKKLDKILNTSGVIVDLDEVKITGIPEDVTVNLTIDFVSLLHTYRTTPSELAAAYLHEIGHAWYAIADSYKRVKAVTTNMENIQLELNKNRPDINRIMLLVYSGTFGDKSPDTSPETTLVELAKTTYEKMTHSSKSPYSVKDNESLADRFVVRFGLGVTLAGLLKKIELRDNGINVGMDFSTLINMVWGIYIFGVLLINGSVLLITASSIIGVFLFLFSDHLLPSKDTDTYDTGVRRLLRIRNEAIRQLRECYGCNKKQREALQDNANLVATAVDMYIAGQDVYGGEIERLENSLTRTGGTDFIGGRVTDELINDISDTPLRLKKI